jgi:dynein heavy chain
MTGTLQTFARKHTKAIDLLSFSFKVLKTIDPSDIHKKPDDGIYVNGLFLEGAKWNIPDGVLEDQDKFEGSSGPIR